MARKKKYESCDRTDGLCGVCSYSSYGRDCKGNEINKVLYYRSLAGLTQQQVADAAGLNIRQIQKYEYGEAALGNMTLNNARALCQALDCTIDELLGGLKNES